MTGSSPSRRFLLLLLAVATGLLALVIAPMVGALFAAAVFAVVMQPMQAWLADRLGGRQRVAAGLLSGGLTVVALLPIGWLTVVVVQQAATGINEVVAVVEERGVDGLIEDLPEPLRPYAERLERTLPAGLLPPRKPAANEPPPDPAPAADAVPPASVGWLLQTVGVVIRTMLGGLAGFLVEMGLMVVALYFLLAEGRSLVTWTVRTAPLPDAQVQQFVGEFRDVTVAVFVSTVTTALLQSAVAAAGYLIVGVPHLAVWLFATLLAAFVPAVGGAVVVAAIGLYYVAAGDTGWGVFLVVWGVVPVGLVDNIVKPWLARRRLRLPASLLFFAMLGGIVTFGVMGVVAGPLIVSFFLVVVRALGTHGERAVAVAH